MTKEMKTWGLPKSVTTLASVPHTNADDVLCTEGCPPSLAALAPTSLCPLILFFATSEPSENQ